jgi:PAS domain S-box-containing protein
MKDQSKTKQVLIQELASLKQRIADLERSESDRKRTEDALRESAEQYRILAENSPSMIFLLDAQGNVLVVNEKSAAQFGMKPDAMIGRNVRDLFPERIAEQHMQAIKKVIRDGEMIHSELSEPFPTGERWIDVRIVPVRNKNGTIIAVLRISHDITDRVRVEGALKESEERYRTLVENATDIVFRTDGTGNCTFVNPATLRITGYDEEEIIGKQYTILIRPDMRDEAMKFFGRQFVKRIQNTYSEYPMLTKDGQEVWFGQNTQLIVEDGHVIGFQAVARDITERKKAEKFLKQSEERYRAIIENMEDGYHEVDINGNFTFFNESMRKIMGYEREELLGMNNRQFADEENTRKVYQTYNRVYRTGEPVKNFEWQLIRKDGIRRDIEVSISLIRDMEAHPIGFRGIVRDTTDRKQAEEQLQHTLDSLRKAFGATIHVLVSAVETRDPYTAGHQLRSADLARAIATEMGFTKERIDGIRMAGSIHDIGKLSIPAEILSKPTKLTKIEFSLIKEHSQRGYEMLKDVESPWPLAEMIYQHHERMDGSGYPRNLKGDDILMEARIMAVADVVESMASHRPYRPARGIDAALEEIEKNKGTLYDNTVADACLRLFREKGFQLEGT